MSRERKSLRLTCAVILGALVVYLVGNASVSLWDRDEPRYAQTSRQMLASGDWVVPKLLDEPREKKPVFIYWCQAAAMALLGRHEVFAVRLPSVIGVTVTLIVLAFALRRTIGPRRAFWTVFVFATTALTIVVAKLCITDGVLILFVVVSQLALYALWSGQQGWATVVACAIAVGFGLLTKGPVVPAVMLMTLLALGGLSFLDRRLGIAPSRFKQSLAIPTLQGSSKCLLGAIIALSIYSLWGTPIERRLPGYHVRTIKAEVLDRAAKPQEGHKGPPGYYLLIIWGAFFPWSLLLPATIISAWKHRHIPQIRFALAAVVGPWIMFEIVQTKLWHYILPIVPALAFLTADMLLRAARKKLFAGRIFRWIVLAFGGLVILFSLGPWLATAIFSTPREGPGRILLLTAMILLPLIAIEYAREIYVYFCARRPLDAAIVMGAGMLLFMAVLFGMYLPNAHYLQVSKQLADVLVAVGATRPGDAIMIDYKETSLAFYQGGTIRPQSQNDWLMQNPSETWPKWIVMSDAIWKRMPQEVRDKLETIQTVHGVNYAGKDADRKHIVDVHVLRKYP
jgi:4-amino-4-deoxy-L-arabinose transferase-like glycosyltransferase